MSLKIEQQVPGGGASAGLSKRTLGVPSLVFLIVAASAPLTAIAGGVTTSFAVSGVLGIPVSFLFLGTALAVFTVGYSAMGAHITNAGAFYAYVAQGLGRATGIGASWIALISYNGMQIGIYGLFGFTTASFIGSKINAEVPWWIPALVALVIIGWLGINKIDLSVRVIAILVGLEFLAVIVFDIVSLSVNSEGLSAASLDPANLFTTGVGAALCFGIASFMGFESAAIYSEESKDPKRSVGRATFIAVGFIAVFYAISAWAMSIGVGASQIVGQSREFGPDLMFVFLTEHGGLMLSDLTQVLFISSLLAALIAFHNAVARYTFSLGRENVFPKAMAYVNPRTHAPVAGSASQSLLALVMLVIFAIAGSSSEMGPLFPVLTFFTWFTQMGAFGLVLLLVLTSLAVIGYFARRRTEYSVWTRVIAPGLSVISLGVVFVLIMVNFDLLIGAEGPSVLGWLLPGLVLALGVAGVLFGLYLKSVKPEVYLGIGHGPGAELD